MLQEINKEILIFFNSLGENIFVEKIVNIFIDLPIFFLPVFLIGAWIYYTYKNNDNNKKQDLLFIFYGTFIALLISLLIQQIIVIDRPETVLEGVGKLLLKHIPDASFPSDHATVSFGFLTGLFFAKYKKIGLSFLPFVILMNISRIIAGVHWPFDILVGFLVGVIGSVLSFKIFYKNKKVIKINNYIIKIMGFIKL